MYLTAHRVVSPRDNKQAINAFYYLHGREWDPSKLEKFKPEDDPGALEDDDIQIPPPGNRVRSYLDIVAPDNVQLSEFLDSFHVLQSKPTPETFPFECLINRIWFRFGCELGLIPVWEFEIKELFSRSFSLLSKHQPK